MGLIKLSPAIVMATMIMMGQEAAGADDAPATLARLELDWANAVERNDVDAIGRFLHPDFTFTSPTGAIANRKDHLEDFRKGNSRFTLVALSEVEARVYGDLAVVTSRPTIDGMAKVNGNVINLKCQAARWTDTLIRRNDSWTCVARHQSNIPPPSTRAKVLLEQRLSENLFCSGAGLKTRARRSKRVFD